MEELIELIKESKVKPLLKWAGGKSMLLPYLIPDFLSADMCCNSTYIEPFMGSGAVSFAL